MVGRSSIFIYGVVMVHLYTQCLRILKGTRDKDLLYGLAAG